MARAGIPRLRHLRHRAEERAQRQPIITDFLTERAATIIAYADTAAVWAELKSNKAVTVAAVVNP